MNIEQAIEALTPTLADRVTAIWRCQFDHMVEEFGPDLKGVYKSKFCSTWREIIRPLCNAFEVSRNRHEYELSDIKIAAAAQKYAEAAANEWSNKIAAKLGDVEYHGFKCFHGCNYLVHATRDGHDIRLDQQLILKSSPKGKLFNQFPARIYVDGKLVSEKKYKEMWVA